MHQVKIHTNGTKKCALEATTPATRKGCTYVYDRVFFREVQIQTS